MWYTALLMGLAGSLHCAGMCSPLAMAVTRSRGITLASLIYNTGRIIVYMLMGAVAAVAGSFVQFSSYQKIFTLILAICFIVWGVSGFRSVRLPVISDVLFKLTASIKSSFSQLLKRGGMLSMFGLGMLNGLLPCGLTFVALSACLILPHAADGVIFMGIFGLGTWPVMIGLTGILGWLLDRTKFPLASVSRLAFILIGCLLLYRAFWIPNENHIASHQGIELCMP